MNISCFFGFHTFTNRTVKAGSLWYVCDKCPYVGVLCEGRQSVINGELLELDTVVRVDKKQPNVREMLDKK